MGCEPLGPGGEHEIVVARIGRNRTAQDLRIESRGRVGESNDVNAHLDVVRARRKRPVFDVNRWAHVQVLPIGQGREQVTDGGGKIPLVIIMRYAHEPRRARKAFDVIGPREDAPCSSFGKPRRVQPLKTLVARTAVSLQMWTCASAQGTTFPFIKRNGGVSSLIRSSAAGPINP